MTSLSVGCPAYNEEAAIEHVVTSCLERLPTIVDDFEVLVVDDGSSDATGRIADELAARDPRVRVFHHASNQGFVGVVRTLVENATKELYVGIGADGEIDTDAIARLLAASRDGSYDVVVGVRESKPNYDPYRKLVSWTYNTLVRVVFGRDFRDIGGPKLWRTRFLKIARPASTSAFLNAELLLTAAAGGARIGFAAIEQRPRRGGVATGARLSRVVDATLDLLRFRLRR